MYKAEEDVYILPEVDVQEVYPSLQRLPRDPSPARQ